MSVLKDRIEFYHTLATLLEAGIPISRALKQRFPGKFHRAAQTLSDGLAEGLTLQAAMRYSPLFSLFERRLTQAGESTGRLPDVFHTLDDWFELNLRLRNRIISGLLYPMFLYLISMCIYAVIDLFTTEKSPVKILIETGFKLLAPAIAYALFRLLAGLFLHRSLVGMIIDCLPILGALQHKLESARFFKAFGLCLTTGIGIEQSIQLSADCCRNQAFRNRFLSLKEILQRKRCTFSEAFAEVQTRRDIAAAIPEMLQTGEQSGNLDVYADRISRLRSEEATLLLERISKLLPLLVYLILVFFIAMKIIGMARSYTDMLNNLM